MYYIGYDIGSSSVKAAIVEAETGKKVIVLNEPQNEMEIVSLHSDWAEQDPEMWWEYCCVATKRAIKEANIDALKQLGVTDIVSMSAVGSLKENLDVIEIAKSKFSFQSL